MFRFLVHIARLLYNVSIHSCAALPDGKESHMKIVITGPTGAIGMALIQKCIREKTSVLAICRRGSVNRSVIPDSSLVEVLEADLSELKEIPERGERFDVFYHLAWAGTTGQERDHMQLQLSNIACTLDAVHLAGRLGCHTFIGAGSQAEYGRACKRLRADTPAFPETGYGMAKLCAGQMSRTECGKLGMKQIWVRFLSVYGPFGNPNGMIPIVLGRLLAGETARLTPAEQIWDFLHAQDAARALYLLGKSDGRTDGKVYVMGSGEERPLKEYIEILVREVSQKTGKQAGIRVGALPYPPGQVMYLGADISGLKEDIGFEPEVSFEDGIRRMLEDMD